MSEDSAEIIVVGAGSLGVNTAYQLLRQGVRDVLLVDKDLPGYGTSNAGAGYVGPIAAGWTEDWGAAELDVEFYGMEFYAALASDYDLCFKRNGHIYAARDEASSAQLTGFVENQDVADSRVVTGAEISALTDGFVAGECLFGGVFQPGGMQLSAGSAVRAVADKFVRAGGRLEDRRPVSGLIVEGGEVKGVDTARGPIRSEGVVVAAGAWTNHIVAPYTLVAQVPLLLHRMITAPFGVPATLPALNLTGYSAHGRGILWVREDGGGLNWGIPAGHSYPRTIYANEPVPERFDQVPLDGVMEARAAASQALRVIPGLLNESFRLASGTTCSTPDNRAIIGYVDEVPGLFVLAGCNAAGIQHGPGWGKAAAELIVRGTSTVTDVSGWDANRFAGRFNDVSDVFTHLTPNRRAVSHA